MILPTFSAVSFKSPGKGKMSLKKEKSQKIFYIISGDHTVFR